MDSRGVIRAQEVDRDGAAVPALSCRAGGPASLRRWAVSRRIGSARIPTPCCPRRRCSFPIWKFFRRRGRCTSRLGEHEAIPDKPSSPCELQPGRRGCTNRCCPARGRATIRTPGGEPSLRTMVVEVTDPSAFAAVHETGVPPVSLEIVVGPQVWFQKTVTASRCQSEQVPEPGEQLGCRRRRERRRRGAGKREHEQRRRHEQERELALHALPPCRSDRSTTTSKATLERPSARSASAPRVIESFGVPDTATAAAVEVAATRIAWFAFRERRRGHLRARDRGLRLRLRLGSRSRPRLRRLRRLRVAC